VHGSPELNVVQGAKFELRRVRGSRAPCMAQGATLWTDMYYVYVLRSQFDGKLYIGYTTNLRNRMQEHNSGEVKSTKSRRPLELVFYEGYKSMEDAKRREHYFKTAKGKSSLNLMLRNSLKTSTI
jgi:putative endonuclease